MLDTCWLVPRVFQHRVAKGEGDSTVLVVCGTMACRKKASLLMPWRNDVVRSQKVTRLCNCQCTARNDGARGVMPIKL